VWRDGGDSFQFFSPIDPLTESRFEKRIMVLPFTVFSPSEGTLSVASDTFYHSTVRAFTYNASRSLFSEAQRDPSTRR
jgi:hypothetical protein